MSLCVCVCDGGGKRGVGRGGGRTFSLDLQRGSHQGKQSRIEGDRPVWMQRDVHIDQSLQIAHNQQLSSSCACQRRRIGTDLPYRRPDEDTVFQNREEAECDAAW